MRAPEPEAWFAPADRVGENVEPQREARTGDVWVLVGDLERALIQAGILAVLCRHLPQPEKIYASGIAAANALLAARWDAATFERGWERLRAAHFLAPAALVRIAALRYTNGFANDLAERAARALAFATAGTSGDRVRLFGEDGIAEPLNASDRLLADRLHETLLRFDDKPAALAAAVLDAAADAPDRIFVVGLDPVLATHPAVAEAEQAAEAKGTVVCAVPGDCAEHPTALSFFLPGSGAAERLMRDGREAAYAWLDLQAGA